MDTKELDQFLNLFKIAVSKVEAPYMRTVYQEMGYVVREIKSQNQRKYLQRNLVGNDIVRTGERIFCYELYHQLRLLMDRMGELSPALFLQAELRKYQVHELLQAMELDPLDANYMPDFLLHTPGTANDHPYVIEVKTDPDLDSEQLTNDIKKIVNFMHAYHYQRGIFLAVNISDEGIDRLIRDNTPLSRLKDIQQYASNIVVMNIEKEHQQPTERRLSNWLV